MEFFKGIISGLIGVAIYWILVFTINHFVKNMLISVIAGILVTSIIMELVIKYIYKKDRNK